MTVRELMETMHCGTRCYIHNIYYEDVGDKNIVYTKRVFPDTIPDRYADYEIQNIYAFESDLHIDIAIKNVSFDDLDGLAAVNCMNVFLCTIATTDDFESLTDVMYSIKELLDWADYTIDNDGNWYDENGNRI